MGYIGSTGETLSDLWSELYKGADNITGGAVSQIGQGLIDKAADTVGIEGDTRKYVDSGINIGKSLFGGGNDGGEQSTQNSTPSNTYTETPPSTSGASVSLPSTSGASVSLPSENSGNSTTSAAASVSVPNTGSATSSSGSITGNLGGFFNRVPPVALGLAGGTITYLISKSPLISALTGIGVSIVGIQLQRRAI